MRTFRILVVDDYEPFRRLVRLTLQLRDDLQIVGEASDGLEAVQKAKVLRPDLILLDIDLPTLNGIQAARQLRDLAPRAQILFLSVESSSDVVGEALKLGAGYVHKLRTQSDLLPAIEMVLGGHRFVSRDLEGEISGSTAAPVAGHHHEMLIYSEDAVLVESFTRFIALALRANKPVISVFTKSHLHSLLQSLYAEKLNVDDAIEKGLFIPLDATEKLSKLMLNDLLDQVRCKSTMSGLVEAVRTAKGERSRIAMCGECTPLLLAQDNAEAAIRLEQVCNDLAKEHELDILCAYPSSSFSGGKDERTFKNICAEHTAVYSR
jgi:DNA-binding NarL/FixJ family response regulator